MKAKTSLILSGLILSTCASNAAVIFSQNFNSSSVVSDYVSATPSVGQFNAISTSGAGTVASITGGALTFSRSGANAGAFSRTTDFSPVPAAVVYTLNLTVSGNSASQTNAAVFQVGSGFGTNNAAETNANTYARFGINFGATAGTFSLRNISTSDDSTLFSGTQTVTWILNNSGAALNYTAPDATSPSIANDTADIWIGSSKIFSGVAVLTAGQSVSDLKFAFNAGSGTIGIDNLSIDAIPEPSAALLGFFATLGIFRRRR